MCLKNTDAPSQKEAFKYQDNLVVDSISRLKPATTILERTH